MAGKKLSQYGWTIVVGAKTCSNCQLETNNGTDFGRSNVRNVLQQDKNNALKTVGKIS